LFEFEKEFNLKLPESYRNVILEYNGGSPEKKYINGTDILFLPIKYGNYNINKIIRLSINFLPKGFFPFGEDLVGATFCISLNKEDYEIIYLVDETGEIKLVAESFEDFMNELSDDPDY
ncbi:MAG: SMI1/KNR4 family protein, partial [Bacteroidetes bacterium]|nr:SMI1/KNR4 family protein [Bacteroidota bacterium]